MGYNYWLEVNKNGNVISFKVSCDEEDEDPKVIEYKVKIVTPTYFSMYG